ncbi:MAG: BON domain-containing protein [Lautropia sp.]
MSRSTAVVARRATVMGLAALSLGLSGCFGMALTGAAVGTLAVMDRRSIGAQTEDQGIELNGLRALNAAFADGSASVSITSFNRRVLLTGQASSEEARQRAEQVARNAAANIRDLYNEIEISPAASFATRTKDTGLTARVKAALVRERNLSANTIKVVSERSTVYLMGLVTEDEGQRAAIIASRVTGASRVVTLFEYITAAELDRIQGTADGR